MTPDAVVVVSVHDVAPSTLPRVRAVLADLDALGARPRVLKVIPDEGGAGDLRRHPDLVRLLREEEASGSEIVLHGYAHTAAGPSRGPWLMRLRAAAFAGPAAEFLRLDKPEVARRLAAGRQILRDAGLQASGFCAPGWLAPPDLPEHLREAGFRYYVGMAEVRDVLTGRRVRMPWRGYMGAGPAQERMIAAAGPVLTGAGRRRRVVKVFLHPQGAPESPAYRRTLAALAALLARRRPATYREILGS